MTRKLVAIHLVCRGARGVQENENTFTTGSWVIKPEHIHEDVVVALHNSKAEPSYLQGRVLEVTSRPEGITKSGNRQRRVDILVQKTATPLQWQGTGTGEKGLVWRE